MKITHENMKRELLCGLARENCITVLNTGDILDHATVARICTFVSTLCREYNDPECDRQSKTCESAAKALAGGDAQKFVELCKTACKTCPFPLRHVKESDTLLQ